MPLTGKRVHPERPLRGSSEKDLNVILLGLADPVVELAELCDLVFRARFLRAELIAGKAEHFEAARVHFFVERLEPLVLRREAALARDVHDQQHLVLVGIELLLLAVKIPVGE